MFLGRRNRNDKYSEMLITAPRKKTHSYQRELDSNPGTLFLGINQLDQSDQRL